MRQLMLPRAQTVPIRIRGRTVAEASAGQQTHPAVLITPAVTILRHAKPSSLIHTSPAGIARLCKSRKKKASSPALRFGPSRANQSIMGSLRKAAVNRRVRAAAFSNFARLGLPAPPSLGEPFCSSAHLADAKATTVVEINSPRASHVAVGSSTLPRPKRGHIRSLGDVGSRVRLCPNADTAARLAAWAAIADRYHDHGLALALALALGRPPAAVRLALRNAATCGLLLASVGLPGPFSA